MRSSTFAQSTLGLLAALAAPLAAQESSYFTLGAGMPVVLERLDPLLSAGNISNHVHSVVGGNGFAPYMDFDQTQTATCSTVKVKFDKSNYWMPALYYKSPHNGSFIRVPEKPEHKIYYKFGTGANGPDLERSEFPKEFRMITGNAMLRSDDGSSGTGGNQLNWQCHQPNYVTPTGIGFPAFSTCNGGGLAATIRFPSCWNGQPFNPKEPQAHMAFPINKDGLAGCNAPFNVKRFPEIMIEYWLDVSSFDGDYGENDHPWTLAMGDNTGYGFHADFINGWEPGKLQAAMPTCRVGNTAEPLDSSTCFGAGSLYTDDEVNSCRVKNIVPEDVGLTGGEASTDDSSTTGGILPHLPGCNPIQPGPQDATIQTDCTYDLPTGFIAGAVLGSQSGGNIVGGTGASPANPAPVASSVASSPTTMATSASSAASVQSSTSSVSTMNQQLSVTPAMPIATATTTTPATSPSETGTSTGTGSSGSSSSSGSVTASDGSSWELAGCYVDQLNPVRSLGGNPEWWGQPITSTNCVNRCAQIGATMAGTENSGQCFCGNTLVGSSQVDSSQCNAKCAGDSSQICGGPARLSLYKKSSGGSKRSHTHRHHARHLDVIS